MLDSWGRSYYSGTRSHKLLSPDEFHAFHRPIRERFFSKPNTACIIAAESGDPWHILGWIAVEKIPTGMILHYLYVKSDFKGHHIGRDLLDRALPTSPVFFTHLTDRATRIMSKKHEQFQAFRYIPHLV